MSNILYVGPYRQVDGWGIAAREYIKAISLTNHSLTIKPITLNNTLIENNSYNNIAEKNTSSTYNTVIQHCLPWGFARYSGVKNIGLCFFESGDLNLSPWINNINLLDLLIVPSDFEKQSLIQSGVKIEIQVVKMPTDVEKYEKIIKFSALAHNDNQFKFYFIGELSTRKNIEDIIIAYNREFIYKENVALILKLSDLRKLAEQKIENVKQSMGLFQDIDQYRHQIIINGKLSDKEILSIHGTCDCYISASYGESVGLGALDALGFGRTPIVNKNSGSNEFINSSNGFLVDSHKVPAIANDRPMKELYNSKDTWYKVDVIDMQKKMREAYEMSANKRHGMLVSAKRDIENHSYENVAKQLERLL